MISYKYKWKKQSICFVFLILLFLLSSGCGPINIAHHNRTRTFVDDQQRKVLLVDSPRRVLSFVSGYDTILLDLIGNERLVAVSYLTKLKGYSLNAEKANKVSYTIRNYAVEEVIKLKPDLVIVPEFTSKDIVSTLESMGIAVVYVNTGKDVETTKASIKKIALAVNEVDKGEHLITMLSEDLKQVESLRAKIKHRKSVLCYSSMSGYTGTHSFFDNMCKYMHIDNAPSLQSLPARTAFTDERIIKMNPDIILVPAYRSTDVNIKENYLHNPAFQSVTAVRQNSVILIPASDLYTSHQYLGRAMLDIMRHVYPEIF